MSGIRGRGKQNNKKNNKQKKIQPAAIHVREEEKPSISFWPAVNSPPTSHRLIIHPGNLAGDPIHLVSAFLLDPGLHLSVVTTSAVVEALAESLPKEVLGATKEQMDEGVANFRAKAAERMDSWNREMKECKNVFSGIEQEFNQKKEHIADWNEKVVKLSDFRNGVQTHLSDFNLYVKSLSTLKNKALLEKKPFNPNPETIKKEIRELLKPLQQEMKAFESAFNESEIARIAGDYGIDITPMTALKKNIEKFTQDFSKNISDGKYAEIQASIVELQKEFDKLKQQFSETSTKFIDASLQPLNSNVSAFQGKVQVLTEEFMGKSQQTKEKKEEEKKALPLNIGVLESAIQDCHVKLERCEYGKHCWNEMVVITNLLHASNQIDQLGKRLHILGGLEVRLENRKGLYPDAEDITRHFLEGSVESPLADQTAFAETVPYHVGLTPASTSAIVAQNTELALRVLYEQLTPLSATNYEKVMEDDVNRLKKLVELKYYPSLLPDDKKPNYEVVLVMLRDAYENVQHNTSIPQLEQILEEVKTYNEKAAAKDSGMLPKKVLLLAQGKDTIPRAPDFPGKQAKRIKLDDLYAKEWQAFKADVLLGHFDIYKDLEKMLKLPDEKHFAPTDRSFVLELLKQIVAHPATAGLIGGRSGSFDTFSFSGQQPDHESPSFYLCFDTFGKQPHHTMRLLLTHTMMSTIFIDRNRRFNESDLQAFLDNPAQLPTVNSALTSLKEKAAPGATLESIGYKETVKWNADSRPAVKQDDLLLYEYFPQTGSFFSSQSIVLGSPAADRYIKLAIERSSVASLYYEYFQLLIQSTEAGKQDFPDFPTLSTGLCDPGCQPINAQCLLRNLPENNDKLLSALSVSQNETVAATVNEEDAYKNLAIWCLREAANGGFALAQYEYGMYLLNNEDEHGYAYLLKAAEQGYKAYIKPFVEVALSPDKNQDWVIVQKIVERGFLPALHARGQFLLLSEETFEEAERCLGKAAEQGWKPAQSDLESMKEADAKDALPSQENAPVAPPRRKLSWIAEKFTLPAEPALAAQLAPEQSSLSSKGMKFD